MLSKRADEIPSSADKWSFEPKWDGFRAVIFRNDDELLLQSRDGKPLDRYFPELRDPLLRQLPKQCILDGEIVIAREDGLDFDALILRIHPAASRVKTLAAQSPASIVSFRLKLEICAMNPSVSDAPNWNWPQQRAIVQRRRNGSRALRGAGLDVVIAKPIAGLYTPDKRTLSTNATVSSEASASTRMAKGLQLVRCCRASNDARKLEEHLAEGEGFEPP